MGKEAAGNQEQQEMEVQLQSRDPYTDGGKDEARKDTHVGCDGSSQRPCISEGLRGKIPWD